MNLLEQLNQRYPTYTGCVGIAGSVSGWFFAHAPEIHWVIVVLGGLVGLLIGTLTLEEKYKARQRRIRRERRELDEFEPDRLEDDDLIY